MAPLPTSSLRKQKVCNFLTLLGPSVGAGLLLVLSPVPAKTQFQLPELLQKPSVRPNVPVEPDGSDGLGQGKVLADHQVGENQRPRAADAHSAVNKHLP